MTLNNENSFVERIGGVAFKVKIHSAEKAKETAEEFIKSLIFKESMTFEVEKVE